MFKYLISINPLGFMYGSAGAFLSPENLVGKSGAKFPPEAATLSGLYFSINKIQEQFTQAELRDNLYVAGPFWAECDNKQDFYVPIPWHKIIAKHAVDEWKFQDNKWCRETEDKLEPDYRWQKISTWGQPVKAFKNNKNTISDNPWKYVSFLHPKIKKTERCVEDADGLFLENSVQISENICLVYLATYPLERGWYRFGGENHIVEINCEEIKRQRVLQLLQQPIQRSFALITPGVWGSTRFSYRYPQTENFPQQNVQILTDKPVPYRYRAKGQLGRGRYAVPAGSVYVLEAPINQPWWEWDEAWFPIEGFNLKRVGSGLCLPVDIKGVN
ncbi:MAG: type III-B CRISPR module-associated Cmr3 family protein [Nostocaceae cyanobacterium]|nr:type III-B CRISPR module-associated Cmr3 family protein [Nostocaceae cyanobacterium]